MDDLVVRTLRTVACVTRLRILSHLASTREATPTELAGKLGIRLDLVCAHLARLSSAGLVQRRRSGPHCYCIGRSPDARGTLSGLLSAWVYDGLRGTQPGAPAAGRSTRRPTQAADVPPSAFGLIFDAATALTHPRRLQIIRHLTEARAAGLSDLARELSMSGRAAERHLDKLIRRGFVRSSSHEGRVLYHLAPGRTARFHARLLAIVRAQWGAHRSRT